MIYSIRHSKQGYSLPIYPEYASVDYPQETVRHPTGISVYQWFLCKKGKGELILDQKRSVVEPGQCFLLVPGIGHMYRGLTEDWALDFVSFTGEASAGIFRSLKMTESGVYSIRRPAVFTECTQKLIGISQKKGSAREADLSKAAYGMLLDLAPLIQWLDPTLAVQEDERLRDLLIYMEENYMRDLPLDELAAHAGISKEYMCTLFKKGMNQTIVQHLKDIRIVHARIFLSRYPEKPVQEIARMCGFESPSYFGKVFREDMHCTPSDYRRRNA